MRLPRGHARTLLGFAAGAVAGGLYAHSIGCRTGTCLLTSNTWVAALFFGVTGAVAALPSAPREPEVPPAASPGPNGARER